MKHNSDTYRAVKDSFWTDILVLDLLPEEKLFYLWLFTNSHLDPCGCYQVTTRTIEYETGLSRDVIAGLIERFIALGRIDYNEQHKEFILLKWKNNNQGFFKAGNTNSIKAIRQGASKIFTNKFKDIVLGWLGDTQAPSVAPTLAPIPEATPQPLTINHEPITKEKEQQHAREQLEKVVEEHGEDLARLFPEIDLPVAVAKLLHHFRESQSLVDPWMTTLKWFQREFKAPRATARASPAEQKTKGELREEAAIQAALETIGMLEEMRNGTEQTGVDSVAGNDSCAGYRAAVGKTSGVVSEVFG